MTNGLLFTCLLTAACSGGGSRPDATPSHDAAAGSQCPATDCPIGSEFCGSCDLVVATQDECPPVDQICQGVCGPASYDCCYCGQDPTGKWDWTVLYEDCFDMCDAFVPPADAGLPDGA